jgi:hypothetical protein
LRSPTFLLGIHTEGTCAEAQCAQRTLRAPSGGAAAPRFLSSWEKQENYGKVIRTCLLALSALQRYPAEASLANKGLHHPRSPDPRPEERCVEFANSSHATSLFSQNSARSAPEIALKEGRAMPAASPPHDAAKHGFSSLPSAVYRVANKRLVNAPRSLVWSFSFFIAFNEVAVIFLQAWFLKKASLEIRADSSPFRCPAVHELRLQHRTCRN